MGIWLVAEFCTSFPFQVVHPSPSRSRKSAPLEFFSLWKVTLKINISHFKNASEMVTAWKHLPKEKKNQELLLSTIDSMMYKFRLRIVFRTERLTTLFYQGIKDCLLNLWTICLSMYSILCFSY